MRAPLIVTNALTTMHAMDVEAFRDFYSRRAKSIGMGYLCWLFFGLPYAYTRKWGLQIFYWLTAGGFFIWAIIDLFRMSDIIQEYNDQVMINGVKEIRSISIHSSNISSEDIPGWYNSDLV